MKRFWKWLEEFARDRQGCTGKVEAPREWPKPVAFTNCAALSTYAQMGPPSQKKPAMKRFNWETQPFEE